MDTCPKCNTIPLTPVFCEPECCTDMIGLQCDCGKTYDFGPGAIIA